MEYCRAQQAQGIFCLFWDPWWNYLGIYAEVIPNILMRAERVKLDSSARTSRNKNTSTSEACETQACFRQALAALAAAADKSAF